MAVVAVAILITQIVLQELLWGFLKQKTKKTLNMWIAGDCKTHHLGPSQNTPSGTILTDPLGHFQNDSFTKQQDQA